MTSADACSIPHPVSAPIVAVRVTNSSAATGEVPYLSTDRTQDDSAIVVRPVDVADWSDALQFLFLPFAPAERESRTQATLKSVAQGSLDLTGLRQAWRAGQPVGVSLTMQQPDGVTLVWPPIVAPSAADPDAVFDALVKDVCFRLDAEGARLGQVLLDTTDEITRTRLYAAGFTWQTHLFFLVRALGDPLPEDDDTPDWKAQSYSEATADRFARLLEATYQGSLDCPWLEGMRTGAEALASHKLSGRFEPECWRIFTSQAADNGHNDDVALCLLNDHPDQDAMEMVYFGVAPEYRGQGLGRALLLDALARAAQRGRAALFLAVDAQNHYANSVYANLEFVELARRTALFRPPGGGVHESSTGS
ncbi:MAG: hypothetical protein B7Z55_03860 [Planctomycetales bacterium 12-60-4]|nr:MAG: hypothetical protein B7Z55_03860 [Planctomycetales bacterium 12-60-4]